MRTDETEESSVRIHLSEIMALEREREALELRERRAVALRAERAREAAKRAAHAEALRAAAAAEERARAAREARQERGKAHEAALLRVRLEVEQRAQAEREQRDLEHRRALKALELEVGRRRTVQALWATLVVGAAAAIVAHAFVIQPQLHAHKRRAHNAERIAEEAAAERASLESRLNAAEERLRGESPATSETTRPAPPGVDKSVNDQRAAKSPTVRPRTRRSELKRSPGRTLEGLDRIGNDPLGGVLDTK